VSDKKRKAKVIKPKKSQSMSNTIRTFLGKDPLPKGKAQNVGFAGSRLKKRKK